MVAHTYNHNSGSISQKFPDKISEFGNYIQACLNRGNDLSSGSKKSE